MPSGPSIRQQARSPSRRRWQAARLALGACGALAGCGGDFEWRFGSGYDVCTGERRPSVVITTIDAATRQPVPIASVTVRQTYGPTDYRHEITRHAGDRHQGASGAGTGDGALWIDDDGYHAVLAGDFTVGTFDLTVSAIGYRDFGRAGVRVEWRSDPCYRPADTVFIEAAMVRAPI